MMVLDQSQVMVMCGMPETFSGRHVNARNCANIKAPTPWKDIKERRDIRRELFFVQFSLCEPRVPATLRHEFKDQAKPSMLYKDWFNLVDINNRLY
jgi:hypothetical protein